MPEITISLTSTFLSHVDRNSCEDRILYNIGYVFPQKGITCQCGKFIFQTSNNAHLKNTQHDLDFFPYLVT